MADAKKNSVAGRVATPKAAAVPAIPLAQPMMDAMEALGKSIGARVQLTAATPNTQTYEGTLFTACPVLNVVIINTRAPSSTSAVDASSQLGDYHTIPISRIQSFQVLGLAPGAESGETSFATARPSIGPVDFKQLRDRERAAIEKLKEEERNRGKGVTKEAQAIFDALRRINFPVRWHNQHEIIVHEAVIISPPYNVEDCKARKDKQEVLNRVKKALEGERRKLKAKEDSERKDATPTALRKGG